MTISVNGEKSRIVHAQQVQFFLVGVKNNNIIYSITLCMSLLTRHVRDRSTTT